MFHDDFYPPSTKDYMSQPLYVRQPCSLQIIQLVECSPPPQPQHKYSPSRLSSSASPYSDSNDEDSSSSAYDSSSSSVSAASSYCSSAEDSAPPVPPSLDNRDPSLDDTYHTRQRRVSLWRDAVYSKDVATSSGSFVCPSSLFRILTVVLLLTQTQPVPLLHPQNEKHPMVVIWPAAIRL